MSPRWQKVFRDLLSNKARTILVVLAIAVGIFAFGSVFITQETLLQNIELGFQQSHATTINLFLSDFDDTLVDWIKRQPGVADAQGVAYHDLKLITSSGKKETFTLTAVPDYSKMRLNLLVPKSGSWPPQKGDLVIERSALAPARLQLFDHLKIEVADKKDYGFPLTGSVYDNGGFPYIFTNQINGFVSWDTLAFLGFPKSYNRLGIVPDQTINTLADAEKLTFELSETLRQRGVEVQGSYALPPHQHWATDNSRAFTAILSVIGVFSLILSGFLVVNTISALLSQQKKQIGIMKAIGARGSQIVFIYLTMVAFYGVLALFIALPIGTALSYFFLKLIVNFLNLDIYTFYIPASVFLLELASALVVPIVAAAIPIFLSTRQTIRSALTDFPEAKKNNLIDTLLAKISFFSRPTLISLRNIFRKKGRLVLTMGTLVTAGALFISVLNVQAGMVKEMDRILSMFNFEVSFSLNGDYSVPGLVSRIVNIPGVTAVEGRTSVGARRLKLDGTKGTSFALSGLPPQTPFSSPILLSGRWLAPTDTTQIVLSSAFIKDNPDLTVGAQLPLEIDNDKYSFEIVGIIAMAGDQKIGFLNFNTVAGIKDKPGLASQYLIKTTPTDAVTQDRVASEVESRLVRAGIKVAGHETKNQIYSSASGQFNFMVFFLLAMAVMVALVGGLGLAGTMSLNVMERTREIGIMRSIGASDGAIRKLVLVEGLLIGIISWLLSIPLSLPLTYGFCTAIGNAFFSRTLAFVLVPFGLLLWLIIVVVISVFASLLPAARASRLSISQTLSYE